MLENTGMKVGDTARIMTMATGKVDTRTPDSNLATRCIKR